MFSFIQQRIHDQIHLEYEKEIFVQVTRFITTFEKSLRPSMLVTQFMLQENICNKWK